MRQRLHVRLLPPQAAQWAPYPPLGYVTVDGPHPPPTSPMQRAWRWTTPDRWHWFFVGALITAVASIVVMAVPVVGITIGLVLMSIALSGFYAFLAVGALRLLQLIGMPGTATMARLAVLGSAVLALAMMVLLIGDYYWQIA